MYRYTYLRDAIKNQIDFFKKVSELVTSKWQEIT